MRRQRTELQAWLWGEVVLAGLLAASLALLLTYPALRTQYDQPQLLLVLETTMALAGVLVALLAGARFSVMGLRTDLLLAAGFLIWSLSAVAFAIVPALDRGSLARADGWAALVVDVPEFPPQPAMPRARAAISARLNRTFRVPTPDLRLALGGDR